MNKENKYLMERWKPTEDIGIIFDDQTAGDRSIEEANEIIQRLRDVANDYDFDLSSWSNGHFIGFKKIKNEEDK